MTPLRGAIIGFGAIAEGHMAGYAKIAGLSIAAVVDISPLRRQYAERTLGIAAYADFSGLAIQELDFIDICTPPSSHSEYSLLGLANDLHVLCEKPVFMRGDDGYQRLLSAIRESNRIFYPCHVYKFAPILGVMKEIISSPDFGRVVTATFRTLRCGHAKGVADWRPDWRRERAVSGGGILRDHGPHSIYLAMDLANMTPSAVSCLMGSLHADRHHDTEDTVLLRMRSGDGVEISFTLSWASVQRNTSYCITGTSGYVTAEGDTLRRTVGDEVVSSVITSGFDDPSHKEWFHGMLLDFTHVISHPARQDELIREALTTALVIDGAYASAEDGGRWVEIDSPTDVLPG